jgi:hypothetical protein
MIEQKPDEHAKKYYNLLTQLYHPGSFLYLLQDVQNMNFFVALTHPFEKNSTH